MPSEKQRELDVVVAGHVCLDMIPDFPIDREFSAGEVLSPGKLTEVDGVSISTGGVVSNTGIPLAKLGMRIAFIAKVGGDEIGDMILRRLRPWGSVDAVSVSKTESSSYTVVIAPPGIDRIFIHSPGTNHTFTSDNIDYELCKRARLFHFGYLPMMRALYLDGGKSLAGALRRVRGLGTPTSMDLLYPDQKSEAARQDWSVILGNVLPHTDLFLPSVEEALMLAQPEKWRRLCAQSRGGTLVDELCEPDYSELAGMFLDWGASIVGLKAGHQGFYLRTGSLEKINAPFIDMDKWRNREIWSPAYRLETIASATGAGDCSIAGFLTALLKGKPPERCLAAANALGRQNLSAPDATSGIMDWQATLQMMDDQTLPRHMPRNMDGWRFDPEQQVAYGERDEG
jgi:sugar/nucleoside kinase (ribokinase family)